jgi:hypothetical protein
MEKTTPAAARAALHPIELQQVQINALATGFRALMAIHPHPDRVRQVFDQLAGQQEASWGFLQNPNLGVVFRDLAETLFQFQPPA